MKSFTKCLIPMAALVMAIAFVAGCGNNPVEPEVTAAHVSLFDLPVADSVSSVIVKPGATTNAIPPYFAGWSVVTGSQTQLRGPVWDLDWYITFLIPNRTTLPRTINIAAKNMNGTWLNYTGYMMLYTKGTYGSSYKVTYVFGGGKSLVTGINMWDATNWALYYHD